MPPTRFNRRVRSASTDCHPRLAALDCEVLTGDCCDASRELLDFLTSWSAVRYQAGGGARGPETDCVVWVRRGLRTPSQGFPARLFSENDSLSQRRNVSLNSGGPVPIASGWLSEAASSPMTAARHRKHGGRNPCGSLIC